MKHKMLIKLVYLISKCLQMNEESMYRKFKRSEDFCVQVCVHFCAFINRRNMHTKTLETYQVHILLPLYSHSQWLFYEFVSKITNKLVKQSLRVTVYATSKVGFIFTCQMNRISLNEDLFWKPVENQSWNGNLTYEISFFSLMIYNQMTILKMFLIMKNFCLVVTQLLSR